MSNSTRGNQDLLDCVALARQVQEGTLTWQSGCTEIARRVLAERVSPSDGCWLLAEVSESIKGPNELGCFEHLAHLQYGHESLGYNTRTCAAEILRECRRLVDSVGPG